ncbi:MAG: DUF5107 domain-containing protein [Anaerolineae bacterium]|nr:DUF5107 domain-containing protein [Anaerolineae bacterium]
MLIVRVLRARYLALVGVILLLAACNPRPPAQPTVISGAPALLVVNVLPEGSTVFINGEEMGQTPLEAELAPGRYLVRVEHEGYTALQEELDLVAGQEGMLSGELPVAAGSPPARTPAVAVQTPVATTPPPQKETPAATPVPAVTATVTRFLPDVQKETTATPQASATPVPGTNTPLPATATSLPPTAAPTIATYIITRTITTYPFRDFWREDRNAELNFPFLRFDRAAYLASNPQPTPQTYQLVVLENEYLRLTILPDVGGRLYEVIFKPTGNNEFYRNPVLKPSAWGPPEQGGWLAAGGMEWGLPVEEHGYEWGTRWGYIVLPREEEVTVTVFDGGRDRLRALVDITLAAGEARFTVRPRVENPTANTARFQFWLNAMLAPGAANRPSADLELVFPVDQMTVHSTGDPRLPGAKEPISWPVHDGRDISRLGTWQQWLGFFVRPAAQGDFMGVYDHAADEGMMRVYPSDVARGAKGFGLGWGANAIPASEYTDDDSAYVELHGGLTPTFWEQAELAPGAAVDWTETWYPVAGIGGVVYADENGAVNLRAEAGGLRAGLFPVASARGLLQVTLDGRTIFSQEVRLRPDAPFNQVVKLPADVPAQARVRLTWTDANGQMLMDYEREMTLR